MNQYLIEKNVKQMSINVVIDFAIYFVAAISKTKVIEYLVFVMEIGFYFFCVFGVILSKKEHESILGF